MANSPYCTVKPNTEKAMAPHSSTFAWKIPWTEEPGRLQSMESLRVRHDWATSLSLFTLTHWRRKWQPTPVFLPGESQGREAWWASVYGVAQSRTRLKRLSSSSSRTSQSSERQQYSKIVLFPFALQNIPSAQSNHYPYPPSSLWLISLSLGPAKPPGTHP